MRVLNKQDLSFAFESLLLGYRTRDQLSETEAKIASWLSESVPKWLLKHVSTFKTQCLPPIQRNSLNFFDPDGEVRVFFYKGLDGVKQRVYLENPFDLKDAEAGILFWFLPPQQFSFYLRQHLPIINEALDFFTYKLEKKPDLDIRKYTLDNLPQHINTWKQELEQERLRQVQARAVALQQLADLNVDEQQDAANIARTFQAWKAADKEALQLMIAHDWKKLIPGVDYVQLTSDEDWVIHRLLTPRALDYEALCQGNCIDGARYKRKLRSDRELLLSMRRKHNVQTPVFTIELEVNGSLEKCSVIQFERYGYHVKREDQTMSIDEQLRLESRFIRMIPSFDKAMVFRTSESVFNVNRNV
jgi:hypothetical protein